MQNKAWNQYSSSSDSNSQDSWFDDDEKPANSKDQKPSKKQEKQQTGKTDQQPSKTANQQARGQKKQPEQVRKTPKQKYEKRGHLTDQELLNLYTSLQVDDPKAIKVSGCITQQAKKILRETKTKRNVLLFEGTHLLFFNTEEDLINFIKAKIQKKYNFYLKQFYQTIRQKDQQPKTYKTYTQEQIQAFKNSRPERAQRQKKPRRQRQREDKQFPKDQRIEKREPQANQNVEKKPKKRYQKQQDSGKQEEKQKRQHEERKQKKKNDKQAQKAKKVYLPKEYFELPENSNNLSITSDAFQIARVLEELQNKKVFKNFNKIYIKTPFYVLKKVAQLCHQLSKKKKYYLEKEPPLQAEKQALIQLTLIENGKINKIQPFVSRFKPKVETVQQINLRLLDNKSEDYFKNIEKYNLSQIVKGFDQNKYINLLREMSQVIQKRWNCWKIQAEQENIEVLLKLSNRIKKSMYYDLQLKPSLRNEKALLTAEFKQRPEKDRRPKVDVSNVNHYLS